jgi:hypothetical protein
VKTKKQGKREVELAKGKGRCMVAGEGQRGGEIGLGGEESWRGEVEVGRGWDPADGVRTAGGG